MMNQQEVITRTVLSRTVIRTAVIIAGFVCFLAASLLFFSCEKVGKEDSGTRMDVKKIEEVFPKYRRWASPSGFITPETNPPSFLWPVTDARDYAIRLSQDSAFTEDVIAQEGLPWAMYNPHQKLAAGTWYWQHRSGDGDWSEKAAFIITEDTPEFVTPQPGEILSQIPESHPRVLLWAEEVESLRKQVRDTPHEDSRLIIAEADRRIHGKLPDEEDGKATFTGATAYQTKKIAKDFSKRIGYAVMDHVEPVCQAYLLTGDQKYADAAMAWTRKICSWDPEGPTSTSDFGESKLLLALAMVYDSFYDHLSEEDKRMILGTIKARGAHFYDEWENYLEAKVLSNHVWQFNLYRLFMTALAVYGDLPEAEEWLEYIYEVWLARSPVLGGNDGGWVHGVSYYHINTVTLLAIPYTLQEISGVNFIRDPFYENNIKWLAHAYPPHSTSDGFGDGSDTRHAPDLQILGYVDAMARLNQDPLASWYVEESLRGGTKSLAHNRDFRWFRLRRGYAMEKPAGPDKNSLPLSAVYPDVGMVYMHTNLNDHRDNLMVAMRSSPYGSHSHMHADQNTFNIAYGGKRLFFNSGYKVSMSDKHSIGWYKATQGHNGILINGKGAVQSASGWGWLPRALHGSRLSYAVGDASNAYDGPGEEGEQKVGLEKFRRHLLMLRPNIIVVYDELETREESTFSWLVHSNEKISTDNKENLVATRNSTAAGEIILTGSQPLDFETSDQFAIEPVNFRGKDDKGGNLFPDQWHFTANSSAPAKKMRFLAIIQVTPEGAPPLTVEQHAPGKYTIGGWQIEAALNVEEEARLSATKTDQTASFTSSGALSLAGKTYTQGGENEAMLVEIIDGEEMIRSTPDRYPPSFYEAYFHSR